MVGSKTSAIPHGDMTKHIPPSWVCAGGVVFCTCGVSNLSCLLYVLLVTKLFMLSSTHLLLDGWVAQSCQEPACMGKDFTWEKSGFQQLYPWIGAQKQGGSIRRMESACKVPRAWVFLGLGKPVPCIPVGNFSVNWTLSPHLIWKVKDRNTRKMHALSLWMWCSVVPAAWEQQLPCKHWATVSFLSFCACYISAIVVFPGESWKFQ